MQRVSVSTPEFTGRLVGAAQKQQPCEDRNVKFLELIVAEVAGSSHRAGSRFPVPYLGSIGVIVGGLSDCRSLPS